jgi:hypothetical protein
VGTRPAPAAAPEPRPAPPAPPAAEAPVEVPAPTPPAAGRGPERRGKGKRPRPAPAADAAPAEAPADAPAAADPEPEPTALRAEADGPRPRADGGGARGSAPGVGQLLDSLRGALDARAVALLRYNEAADAYEVAGRAGEGFGGVSSFPAAGNALHRVSPDGSIALLEPDAFGALRYHARPDATVGHAAALAVEAAGRHLLVADRGTDDGPFAPPQLDLLGDYADLAARLLGASPGPRPPVKEAGAAAPVGATEADLDADLEALFAAEAVPAAAPLPQRRAILAEEMAAAREAGRPLAFALVVPREAEPPDEAAADHAAVEDALRARLEAAEGTARVERFGDGLMGAFCYLDAAEAEDWAGRVADAGEPVHIGVAVLGAQHEDPDALRADAAAALHEAYERDETCVILE